MKVLHEVVVQGHALDQLDEAGKAVHDKRHLRIDEEVTRWRNPFEDQREAPLFQLYGWAQWVLGRVAQG